MIVDITTDSGKRTRVLIEESLIKYAVNPVEVAMNHAAFGMKAAVEEILDPELDRENK